MLNTTIASTTGEEDDAIKERRRLDGSMLLDSIEKRKKVDLVVCCIRSGSVRTNILEVCKSLNIPMVAIRVLGGGGDAEGGSSRMRSKQGTVEFVLPRESKLYEPKEKGEFVSPSASAREQIKSNAAAAGGREIDRNGHKEYVRGSGGGTPISNKVQPLGLLLAGLGANAIIKVIGSGSFGSSKRNGSSGGSGVPSFLRYDLSTGETSNRLPKK